MRKRFFYYCMCCHAFYNECHSFCGRNSGKLFGDGENNDIWNNSDSINFWIITTFCWNVKFLFGTNDTVATSALGSFTISSTSVPSGSTISKIVVTSTKSSGSSGNIELFVAKDEDNGDGTFDRYTDSKSWNSSLTFADFGNYNLSPVGNYYVQFESTRYSTGTVAAATLKIFMSQYTIIKIL